MKKEQRINPPIRGSIVDMMVVMILDVTYQSPYKGFNRTR